MSIRAFAAAGALLLVALACRDDADIPTDPISPRIEPALSAAAALEFWQVSAGGGHACGLTTEREAYCWGSNGSGQLGNGTRSGPAICLPFETPICSPQPVAVIGGLRFRSLSSGGSHTCGVTFDDRALCWGANSWGQIGDGTGGRTLSRAEPVAVVGGLAFRQVTAGSGHTCGRTTTNLAYCWGVNDYGQLGDGTTVDHLTPRPVAGSRRFQALSAGSAHTCGITTVGEAFCWGSNRVGQIGDSSTAVLRRRPTRVAGGHVFRQLDAGSFHTCAVTTGSRALCWGDGRQGAIGDGSALVRYEPRAVRGRLSFQRVTAGDDHSCGETATDRAYCWGLNGNGQVGDGTTSRRLIPVAVAGGLLFDQLSAGGWFTCGKTIAAEGYCWGYNGGGQLGDGTQEDRLTPAEVVGPL